MNNIIRNISAVVVGIVFGSIVNMGIIMISGSIIPPPEGVITSDMESIKASMHLYQPIHFLFPFLAHALGTFVGALLAALIAGTHKMKFALGIGAFFLIGGIVNNYMLAGPMWFSIVDVISAYIPMAWLGGLLIVKRRN